MAARDQLHNEVIRCLENDGWTVTHDPFVLRYGTTYAEIDLGAERLIAVEKGSERIAVEIKSFLGPSALSDFHVALGQYLNYREALLEHAPERELFLAIPDRAYETFFALEIVQRTLRRYNVAMVIFNVKTRQIVQWIKTS